MSENTFRELLKKIYRDVENIVGDTLNEVILYGSLTGWVIVTRPFMNGCLNS